MPDEENVAVKVENKRQEKGQALIEFAVSLVIIMIILSGILDLGRLFFYYIAMRDAAQEGVVYGMIEPEDCAEIVNRTEQLLSDDSRTSITITINGNDYPGSCSGYPTKDTGACSPNEIRVTVTDPAFPITMPFLGAILGRNSLNVDASVSGTILRPSCP